MTKKQKYIILGILALVLSFVFFNKNQKPEHLPNSIGDPLELIIIKSSKDFNTSFFQTLKTLLNINIGPSPQVESILDLIEIEKEDFKGLFRRHQNLLFISKSEKFEIKIKKNVFANNQTVILMNCPSKTVLNENSVDVMGLVEKIKEIEMRRSFNKFKNYINKPIGKLIENTHNIRLALPKDFFLAHNDSLVTWVRREKPNSSQGILIISLKDSITQPNENRIINKLDLITKEHVSSSIEKSYMISEKNAPITIDSIIINNISGLKIQSLWRMENDFMGGVFNAYYFNSKVLGGPLILYTYLFAPGEKKSILLLQLEAIIHTIKKAD